MRRGEAAEEARRDQAQDAVPRPAEVRTLADAIDPHYKTAVYVAAWCGFRAGEQWALRRDDVDLDRGTLRVDEAIKEVTADSTADLRDVRELTPSLIIGVPKTEGSERTVTM